ncbi:MAG: hypothetical protein Q7S84_02215 [bacterium]|nr:hypothetical protein [bacterium]
MATLGERIGTILKRAREHFIVIEEADSDEAGRGFTVTPATVDHVEQRVALGTPYHANDFRSVRRRLFPFDRGVVVLDGRRATTVESIARVRREVIERPIDEGELDTLVFKALWEFLNRYRSWAAKKMDIADLDLTLAAIEVINVSLDGHRLLNPIGFRGGVLAVGFRGTFVPRTLAEAFNRFHGWVGELTVAERGSLLASTLLKGSGGYLLDVGEQRTTVFIRRDEDLAFLREFDWGAASVITAVAEHFMSSPLVARELLTAVAHGRTSERFARAVDRVLRLKATQLLEYIDGLSGKRKLTSIKVSGSKPAHDAAVDRSAGDRLVHFRASVPRFQTLLSHAPISCISADQVCSARGFTVVGNAPPSRCRSPLWRGEGPPRPAPPWRSEASTTFSAETFAAVMYPYARREYGILNQLLRRRARWLIAQP